jgi:rhamnosyltransferase
MNHSTGVCCIIVTYECGLSVEPTYRSVLPQVDRVIFVDNGSGEETVSALRAFQSVRSDSVDIISLEENQGIARALNIGMRKAGAYGFRWALTMDHDSVADDRMVDRLLAGWRKWPSQENVLICAPVFINRSTMAPGGLIRYDGWKRVVLIPPEPGAILDPTVVITSGSLVQIELHERVGGFDEKLFIDYVDHDFCLRGRRMGLEIIVPADAYLYHSIGNPVSRRVLGRPRFSLNHSPIRRYTIGRNRAEMIRRYAEDFPGYAFWSGVEYLKDALAILICEVERWEKLKMMGKGVMNARKYFSEGKRQPFRRNRGGQGEADKRSRSG